MKFLDALIKAKNKNTNIVIPDIKCFSPKEGDLMRGRNPVDYAITLQKAGAPVVSVVTEEKEFHGSLSMLREIAAAIDVPILRKDFIHSKEELIETKEAGASAILLMCSCLEKEELKYLYHEALAIGLDPFVETHVKEDFDLVNELGAKLVGINNRDILVLEKDDGDVSNTLSLASYAPEDAFLVTESSIKNPDEVRAAIKAGADAALVGTAILCAEYTESFYKMMCRKISLKICGLMNKQDIELCIRLGVDKLGLVVEYPIYVPWNLSSTEGAALRKLIPVGFKACMVTGGNSNQILERAYAVNPDMVQLHYKEDFSVTKLVSSELKKKGIETIKTVPVSPEICLEQFGVNDISEALVLLNDSEVSYILVDPRNANNVCDKQLVLDVELAKQIIEESDKSVIIAGGINADNLKSVIIATGCCTIDIMNGSEEMPGKKSEEKISRIIEILQSVRI